MVLQLTLQLAVVRVGQRLQTRWSDLTSDQDGQTSAEYMGMLLVVVAILLAVIALAGNIGSTVAKAISSVFDKVARQLGA
jgi:Flp pilus assembly pilin Flp